MRMRNNRAKFDKAEYDKSNPIAIEAMEGWLAEKIPDLIVDSTEDYGFDIRGTINGGESKTFYEVEIKYSWKGAWPSSWRDIRIPYRKKRLLDKWKKDHYNDLLTFVVFREDCQQAWFFDGDTVLNSEVKEVSNRNIQKGEMFFHLETKDGYIVDID